MNMSMPFFLVGYYLVENYIISSETMLRNPINLSNQKPSGVEGTQLFVIFQNKENRRLY